MSWLKKKSRIEKQEEPTWLSYWEQLALHPDYISPNEYEIISKTIRATEKPDVSLIEEHAIKNMISRIQQNGNLSTGGGGWGGIRGEIYIAYAYKTTAIASDDAETFARMEYAFETVKAKIEDMYEQGVLQRILFEFKQQVLEEFE